MARDVKERIYIELFNRIFDGRYESQTRLKEAELAGEFGVSRTPIREVLQQLAKDGMVQILPNRGAVVHSLTADDIEEIYEIRRQLELLALEFAVPAMSLRRLAELRSRVEADLAHPDREAESNSDNDLHLYIILASNRPRLINMLSQLLRLIHRFRYLGFGDPREARRATREHLQLIDALIERDLAKAKAVLNEHVDNSKRLAISILTRKPAALRSAHSSRRSAAAG
ncbi:MAG: GntR family transcriptional regulator [Spirochaetales bacterium]|nr:GntR family transcriptional regulator [Spirochaetales bacterium]